MEPVPFAVDISSEEEEAVEQERRRLEEKVDMSSTDNDWLKGIKGFLEMCDEGEVAVSTKKVKAVGDDDDDDDDDCVILEGDPEKLVTTSVSDSPTGSDSDELCVVGEKGQIACRDYPHPRHLCANFPYSSTPHQRHCGQCHCYVCDSLAPCPKWGTGDSSTDHCHATDKSEMWKTLRQNFKLGSKTASLAAAPTNCGTLADIVNFQHNHIMPLDISTNSMLLSPNSMFMNQPSKPPTINTHSLENIIPQNQASQQVVPNLSLMYPSSLNQLSNLNTVPLCSTASNFTTLNGANRGILQDTGSHLVSNRYHSHSDSRQMLGVSHHAIQRKRGLGARSLRPPSSHVMSNGVNSLGFGNTLTMNHSTPVSSGFTNHVNPALQYGRNHAATRLSNSRAFNGYNDVSVPQNLLYPQPNSYEPQAYYQSNDSQKFYGNYIQGNAAPPSSYMAHLNRSQHLYEPQIGTQSEQYVHGNIAEYGATGQDAAYQLRPQSEDARVADFAAFDSSSLVENTSSNNNISCLQSSGSMNIPPYVEESSTQFKGSTNLSVDDGIKYWAFDDNCVPAEVDAAAADAWSPLAATSFNQQF